MSWADTARAQGGVVTREQLRSGGLTRGVIDRMVRSGALVSAATGVYLARGAPRSYDANLWIAVLTTRGVLSHATAAHLWGMLDGPPDRTHVTILPQRRITHPSNVRLHRLDLPTKAVTVRHGLPVTARTWTALDHLTALPLPDACTFADRALQREWLCRRDIEARLRDRPRRWGNPLLARIAAVTGDGAQAQSERLLHRILRRAGLTGWTAQHDVWVAGYLIATADVAFPVARLIIEVDGWAHHSAPDRFQRDRTRQNDLVAAGWTVLRFTWRDLTERPGYVAAAIRRQLDAAA